MLPSCSQIVGGRFARVLLERTQATSQVRNIVHRRVDNGQRVLCLAGVRHVDFAQVSKLIVGDTDTQRRRVSSINRDLGRLILIGTNLEDHRVIRDGHRGGFASRLCRRGVGSVFVDGNRQTLGGTRIHGNDVALAFERRAVHINDNIDAGCRGRGVGETGLVGGGCLIRNDGHFAFRAEHG